MEGANTSERSSVRVTVVVPLYNKAPYVSRCLNSVLSQTYRDFEIIVVDDGSTDHSAQIVGGLSMPGLRLVRQANAGPGAARNRGLREARGEYVAFLDADDEWLPEYLARGVHALDEAPQAAATTSCYLESPRGRSAAGLWRQRGIQAGLVKVTPELPAEQLVHYVAYMIPCCTLARTQVLRDLGGFYEDRCLYGEDAFLFLQVLLNNPVLFNLEPLARIHRDAAQLSGNLDGPRPVEPFLVRPELVRAACPPGLERLLDSFLTWRAFKTACVLGYWGDWRAAGDLRRSFAHDGSWRLRYALPSLVCATPMGAWLGTAARQSHALLRHLTTDRDASTEREA
jgi:glycosyltransferase involved in cell wall biosynthesis